MSTAVLTTTQGPTDVLTGEIFRPRRGVWIAKLEVDADAPVSGAVDLTIASEGDAPAVVYTGTAVQSQAFEGRTRVTVYGGKGALEGPGAKTLGPKNYVSAPLPVKVSHIVDDIAREAGETVAAGVLPALEAVQVVKWLRAAGTGTAALNAITHILGGWRMLPDGTLWAGAETWPEATPAGLYQQGNDGDAFVLEVAPDDASLAPGTVVLGKRIEEVVYTIGEGLRAYLYYSEAAA